MQQIDFNTFKMKSKNFPNSVPELGSSCIFAIC